MPGIEDSIHLGRLSRSVVRSSEGVPKQGMAPARGVRLALWVWNGGSGHALASSSAEFAECTLQRMKAYSFLFEPDTLAQPIDCKVFIQSSLGRR
jgi:hypothetical protein